MIIASAILVNGIVYIGVSHGDALRKAEEAGAVHPGAQINYDLFICEHGELVTRESTRNKRIYR